MGAEFFAFISIWPVSIVIVGLVLVRLLAPRPWLDRTIFGISHRAMIMGVFGTLIGLFIYSAQDSYFMAVRRVAEYKELNETGVFRLALGWTVFAFFLYAGFVLLLFAVLCVPVLAALSRLQLISVAGLALVAAIIVSLFAANAYWNPYNFWCDRNEIACVQREFIRGFSFWLPVLLGFAFGARLPLLISNAHGRTED